MGTKIQPNGLLMGYHSVIDIVGSSSDGVRSVCNGNQAAENGQNRELLTSSIFGNGRPQFDLEKVRQTILEQESTFRGQLQELHHLYRRQKELMNEVKKQEINKAAAKEVRSSQSSFLFSPEDANRTQTAPYLMAGCSSASGNRSYLFPTLLEGKVVPSFLPVQDMRILSGCEPSWMLKGSFCPKGAYGAIIQDGSAERQMQERFPKSQCNGNALTLNLYPKRRESEGDIRITSERDGIPDNLMLARGTTADSSSTFNLTTKDFFQSVQDGTNGVTSLIVPGFRNERKRNDQWSDDHAENVRISKHASNGEFCVGKSPLFPQPSPTEPNKQLRQMKRKLFGVEIEGYESSLNIDSKNLNTSELNVVSGSSSWINRSFANNLELNGKINSNSGNTEIWQADSKGENRKWFPGCSDVGLGLDKVSESREVSCTVITDCQNKDKPNGALPWFLRNSQKRCGSNKEAKSSYFMNLDSLQSSQNFFRKNETADGPSLVSMQKAEVALATANESSTGTTKLLGFPISGVLQSSEDPHPKGSSLSPDVDSSRKPMEEDYKDTDLQKGTSNYISNLRHHIDLNYSLDEEASPMAPSLPMTVVKIATTEIDLEAQAVIESETDASPKVSDSSKTNMPSGEPDPVSEEHDQLAADALLAISMDNNVVDNGAHDPPEAAISSISCLKWFAEIVSSQSQQLDTVRVEEEFIPDSMDYFEYMTLKLEETKENEHYQYEPITRHNPTDEDTGNVALLKRPQRGQSRRGRQRKDFQRDILPGMITLARLEVTEDLQTFDELMKAEGGNSSSNSSRQSGYTYRSSTRNGKGRKRPRGPTTRQQQPTCQLENRSLTGWGKKTRRLPRQRCHNAFLSFPVKC